MLESERPPGACRRPARSRSGRRGPRPRTPVEPGAPAPPPRLRGGRPGRSPHTSRASSAVALGVVHVALHLAQGDRRPGHSPSANRSVPRVLPALVLEPLRRAALYSTNPSPSLSPRVEPLERTQRVRPEVADERVVAGPPPDSDSRMRKRASRRPCRSSAGPGRGGSPPPQLVDDLAGLLLDGRVVAAPAARQRPQRPPGEGRPEKQRLQARDQGVAAEDRS